MGFNLSGNWMSFPRVAYITMAWVILMLYYIEGLVDFAFRNQSEN